MEDRHVGFFAALFLRRLLIFLSAMVLSSCTGLFFYPQKKLVRTPKDLGLFYDDLRIPITTSKSGGDKEETLHAWLLHARPGLGVKTIVFFHGNAENISTHINSVSWLPAYGYNVLLADYRGYGQSSGSPSVKTIHEDAAAVLRYLDDKPWAERLVLFGQSLGGAVVIWTVGMQELSENVCASAVEGAFSSYKQIASEKAGGGLFGQAVAMLISDAYCPLSALQKSRKVPRLFIHGGADDIVPFHHSLLLYAESPEPKDLWLLPGARHLEVLQIPRYRERFLLFLNWAFGEACGVK